MMVLVMTLMVMMMVTILHDHDKHDDTNDDGRLSLAWCRSQVFISSRNMLT
jgi:hypothetical protein